ncbi:MAG: hypothetical protein Q8L55_16225 [Phycisphaerales bacterium]|nr:hypothetical protein [Phycisphaerales bacterium]
MLHRGSTFRLFVTLLLAVAVPFCCCNFHSWLSVCVPCEAAEHPAAIETVAHHHEHATAHDHDSDHHADRTTSSTDGNETSPSPCGPGHDDDDCTCGKQNTLLTVAKPTLEFPTPVLVAILSFPTIADSWASTPFRSVGRDLWVASRPPTTLLLLHCALIV